MGVDNVSFRLDVQRFLESWEFQTALDQVGNDDVVIGNLDSMSYRKTPNLQWKRTTMLKIYWLTTIKNILNLGENSKFEIMSLNIIS